jgi:hypothetical protein
VLGRSSALALVAVSLLGARAEAERTPLGISLEAAGYQPIANPPGIVVYKDNDSPVIRLAAEAWLPDSPARLREVLLDYEHQVGRVERLVESRVLARGDGWLRVYQRLDLPVIDDRDYTLLVRWGQEGSLFWVSYQALDEGPPVRPGVVRVTRHSGSWQLRAVAAGGSFVRFPATIDMAGAVPRWMVRGSAGKEVPHLFASVCDMARGTERRDPKCNMRR